MILNPSESEASSALDMTAHGGAARSPRADFTAATESRRSAAANPVPEKGRALLLDDDPTLREIITAFLTENGYTVVPVQNGGEGVREVLAGDFALVICDFKMPGLPGDMFYRAVERIRPDLCNRFVFMTGHRDDARTLDFIRQVSGVVLWKPFQLKELQDAITLQEVRSAYQSIFAEAPSASALSPEANFLHTTGSPHPNDAENAAKIASIVARARRVPAPKQPIYDPPPFEPEARTHGAPRGIPRGIGIAVLVLLLVFGGRALHQYLEARARIAAASAQRLELKARWARISTDLTTMLTMRSQIEADQSRLPRIEAERTNPRWTPLLRLAEPGIEILEIQARDALGDSGASVVRIRGVAGGPDPRLMADRFRQTVEKSLGENAKGRPVSTGFEQRFDAAGAIQEMRFDFVVLATIGSSRPGMVTSKEER